jgi:hypothetical protein
MGQQNRRKKKINTSGKIKKRQNHANLEADAHADHAACRRSEAMAVMWGHWRRLARDKDKDTCTVKPRRKRLVGIDRTIVAFIEQQDIYRTTCWFCFVGMRRWWNSAMGQPRVPLP